MGDDYDDYPEDESGEVTVVVSHRFTPVKRVDHWYVYDNVKCEFLRDFRGKERPFKNERLARQLVEFLNGKD